MSAANRPSTHRFVVLATSLLACSALLAGTTGTEAEGTDASAPTGEWAAAQPMLAELLAAAEAGTPIPGETIEAAGPNLAAEALAVCAVRDDAGCIERLVGAGVAANAAVPDGTSALIAALAAGSHGSAEALIAAGADVDAPSPAGSARAFVQSLGDPVALALVDPESARLAEVELINAIRRADPAGAKRALASGASADATVDDLTVLHLAVMSGSRELVELLAEAGANPNRGKYDTGPPAAIAILAQDQPMLKTLLDAGADPNGVVRGVRLVSLAALSGNQAIVDDLLRSGARPDWRNDDGTLPATVAAATGAKAIARTLGGAPEGRVGANAPDLFAAIASGDAAATRAALAAGASPGDRDQEGVPALVVAGTVADAAVLKALLSAATRADLLAVSPDGSGLVHAVLARDDPKERYRLGLDVLGTAHEAGALTEVLGLRDRSGRSGAVLAAARLGHGLAADDTHRPENSGIFETLAAIRAPDADGVTPHAAAIMAENVAAGFLMRPDTPPEPLRNGLTLPELARLRGAEAFLYLLPDDRPMPEGLVRGAGRPVLEELQRRLAEWGYYTGAIDGIFGPGSIAALRAMLDDRAEELESGAREMLSQIGRPRLSSGGTFAAIWEPDGTAEQTVLSTSLTGPACSWTLVRWANVKPNYAERLIGCFPEPGGSVFDRPGVVLVTYRDAGDDVRLIGDGGWEGSHILR